MRKSFSWGREAQAVAAAEWRLGSVLGAHLGSQLVGVELLRALPAFTHEVKWPMLSEMTASSCRQLDFLEPRTLGAYKRDCFVPGSSSNYLTAKAVSFVNKMIHWGKIAL